MDYEKKRLETRRDEWTLGDWETKRLETRETAIGIMGYGVWDM